MTDTVWALVGLAFVTSITPGPSNLLLLASGLNFGFRRSLLGALGVTGGFLTLLAVVRAGLAPVLQGGVVSAVFKTACVGYVLWLAWNVARSGAQGPSEAAQAPRPLSFWQAWWLQWINPKAWTVAAIAAASYPSPGAWGLVSLVGVFGVVNLPSVAVWAGFGVFFRRLFSDPAKARVVNLFLAVLLVASMVPVLLHLF